MSIVIGSFKEFKRMGASNIDGWFAPRKISSKTIAEAIGVGTLALKRLRGRQGRWDYPAQTTAEAVIDFLEDAQIQIMIEVDDEEKAEAICADIESSMNELNQMMLRIVSRGRSYGVIRKGSRGAKQKNA